MTVPEITLHVGVHRTGTTALQQLLQRRSGRLAAAGTGFLGPRTLRRGPASKAVGRQPRADKAGQGGPSAHIADLCAREVAAGAKRIVISEENLVGSMHVNLASATLYPNAATRLACLRASLPVAPLRVILTIRDFAGYWRSVYAHMLLTRGTADLDAAALVVAPGCSWLPLLRAVRVAFPASPLLIARHRRNSGFVPALAATMVGADLLGAGSPPDLTVNASLPGSILDRLRDLPEGPERSRTVAEARRAEVPAVDPFSPEQRAALDARFETEWTAIAAGAVPGVEIVAAEMSEAAR